MQSLTIIRGLPGSGKSTLARKLHAVTLEDPNAPTPYILEMDMWRSVDGVYVYDTAKNEELAQACFLRTRTLLVEGESVIVTNTFIRRAQVEPYRILALVIAEKSTGKGCSYQELTCKADFGSIHNVPTGAMRNMERQFQL